MRSITTRKTLTTWRSKKSRVRQAVSNAQGFEPPRRVVHAESLLANLGGADIAKGATKHAEAAPAVGAASLLMFGISGPKDGVVEIFSPLELGAMKFPIRLIDSLIAILSSLDRSGK